MLYETKHVLKQGGRATLCMYHKFSRGEVGPGFHYIQIFGRGTRIFNRLGADMPKWNYDPRRGHPGAVSMVIRELSDYIVRRVPLQSSGQRLCSAHLKQRIDALDYVHTRMQFNNAQESEYPAAEERQDTRGFCVCLATSTNE